MSNKYLVTPSKSEPYNIVVSISGEGALFTDPWFVAERKTMPVPSKSALKGILRAVYKHDGMNYDIKRVFVCNPIETDVIWRNEVTEVQTYGVGFTPKLYIDRSRCSGPRGNTFLKNVRYIVEAQIVELPHFWPDSRHHTLKDHYKMFFRHLDAGGCQHTPWLGCREYEGIVEPFSGEISSYYQGRSIEFGDFLLEDILYTQKGEAYPVFAKTGIEDGLIVYGDRIYPKGLPGKDGKPYAV